MGSLAIALLVALSAEGERVAVLELKPQGVPAELAHTLTGVVAEQAGKVPGVTAMSQSEIAAMLGLERQKQMLGCGDESCLAELGGALGAKEVLSGSLGLVGGSYVLQVELVDTGHAKVIDRESKTVTTQGELVPAARDLAWRLLTGQALDTSGKLKLVVSPMGAEVLVDGQKVGESPLADPIKLGEGKHKLLIQAGGYVSAETTVETVPGQTLFNEVNLVSMAPIEEGGRHNAVKTIGWVSLGVSAAAFGAASYFGVQANQAYGGYQKAIYENGDLGSGLYGASYYKGQTVSNQTPANICFATGGVTAALALALELWGYLAK